MSAAELQLLLGSQARVFDRLLEAVGEEHARESAERGVSPERRQAERVERLLQAEMVDTSDIAYDFEGWHLGAVARGPGAEDHIRGLAGALDLCLFMVAGSEERTVWAWLGARRPPEVGAVLDAARSALPEGVLLALGEAGDGLGGWRITHRQAAAVLPVAQRGEENVVRYADRALLASILQDELLATSLARLYLTPLENERDGGACVKETLRAYFAAGRNVSSTAAKLGVRRHTVTDRLRVVEEAIGRPIEACAADLAAALDLEQLAPDWTGDRPSSVHIGRAEPRRAVRASPTGL